MRTCCSARNDSDCLDRHEAGRQCLTGSPAAFRYQAAGCRAEQRMQPSAAFSSTFAGHGAPAAERRRRPTVRARSTFAGRPPRAVEVRTGATDGEGTEIVSGLAEGGKVVILTGRRGTTASRRNAPLIRFRRVQDVWPRRGTGQGAGCHRPVNPPGRVRGHHGPVGLGQVDGDEHHRLPRWPTDRHATALDGRAVERSTATSAPILRNR